MSCQLSKDGLSRQAVGPCVDYNAMIDIQILESVKCHSTSSLINQCTPAGGGGGAGSVSERTAMRVGVNSTS